MVTQSRTLDQNRQNIAFKYSIVDIKQRSSSREPNIKVPELRCQNDILDLYDEELVALGYAKLTQQDYNAHRGFMTSNPECFFYYFAFRKSTKQKNMSCEFHDGTV